MYDVAKIYYEFGEIEGIKVMLADGLDINAQDALGRTLLMLAAAEGHFDTVKFLVEHGADVNPQKYKGEQTLSFQGFVAFGEEVYGEIATYYTPYVDVVRDSNEREGEYYSALAYACQYSNFEIAKYLVLKGAKIIREPGKIVHGFTALDYSIVKQSEEGLDFLRFLKNQGTDLTNAVYALHIACKFNDLETAKILLGAGIDVNMQDECGRTALCFISRPKEGSYYDTNSELIDFFLEKGADINLQDDAGMTFFMYFCRAENLENIKRIYKYVTDVNLEDKVGRTALTHACYSQYDYKIADFLIEQGAKIETEKRSALREALCASHYAMFSILLDKGANVAFHTKDCSYDVFDEACFFLEYDFINRMLQKGEDINRRDETGQTHLMKFCGGCCSLNVIVHLKERGKQLTLDELKDLNWVNGFNKMVKYLIKNGADVNAVDEFGWTALMHICARGCKEIAETLLENGANVNAQNACGGTALMNACSNGNNLELIKLLLDSGADVNLQDEDGDTALMNLIRCAGGETGFGLSIEEYVQRGFHTDEYEDDSEAEKIEHERLMEAIKALLAKGADVTLKNKAGQNALDLIRSKYENSTYYSRCSEISDILNEAWIKQKKAQLEAQKKDYRKQQSKKKHLKIPSRRKPKSK